MFIYNIQVVLNKICLQILDSIFGLMCIPLEDMCRFLRRNSTQMHTVGFNWQYNGTNNPYQIEKLLYTLCPYSFQIYVLALRWRQHH